MRVAKDNVDVRMEIPGAVIRQRTDFGDVSGFDKISGEYFTLSAGVASPLVRIDPGLLVRRDPWDGSAFGVADRSWWGAGGA